MCEYEFDDELYDLYLDILEIESDEREEEAKKELCRFYHKHKNYALYSLLEAELTAYPLSELCEDYEV